MPHAARTAYPSLAPSATELEQAAAQLCRFIDADSTSGSEEPGVAVALEIARELELPAERVPAAAGRDNVYVGEPAPEVLMCTHLDTVPPFLPSRREGPIIWGRGAADAKGVAIAMLHALRLARRAVPRASRAGCLLVVGEETDHLGAKAALGSGRFSPRRVILGEPCGMAPAVGQKGLLKLSITTTGKSGHSAYPELGVSAVHRLVAALHALLGAQLPEDQALGQTTVNIGEIHGGLAANVIAPRAEAVVLVRCAAPVDAVKASVKDQLGGDVMVTELSRSEPIDFDTLGEGEVGPAVPFNTDASILAQFGVPVALMGPGDMRSAHGEREHVVLSDLAEGIERYAQALVRLS